MLWFSKVASKMTFFFENTGWCSAYSNLDNWPQQTEPFPLILIKTIKHRFYLLALGLSYLFQTLDQKKLLLRDGSIIIGPLCAMIPESGTTAFHANV